MRVVLILLYVVSFSSTIQSEVQEQKNTLDEYYFAAARLGDIELINEFFAAGMGVDRVNNKGYSALMIAAYNGQKTMVENLLHYGANACAEDRRGNTALMAAIFKGEFSIAKVLLAAECDPNHQNRAGQTPLMYAALFDRKEFIDALKKHGADIKVIDSQGYDAADIAASQGNQRLANQLRSDI